MGISMGGCAGAARGGLRKAARRAGRQRRHLRFLRRHVRTADSAGQVGDSS